MACWLKCWTAIKRLQVQAPLGTDFFLPMSILSSTLENEEVLITASFRGDVKPLAQGSWLILAICCVGLLVKVLDCNPKVAGSSPTRYRLFLPMSILSSTLENEEVFITTSFRGDVKPSVPGSWLIFTILASLLNGKKKSIQPFIHSYNHNIFPSIHPSFNLSFYSSIHLHVHVSLHFSIHSYIHPSIHPYPFYPFYIPPIFVFINAPSIYSSFDPTIHPSFHPFILPSIHVFIHPSFFPFSLW